MRNLLLFIACLLTGYDYKTLKNYDGPSRRKIGVFAIVMIFPPAIYALDGYLVTRNVCGGTLTEAVIASIISAFLIFMLERAIVLTKATRGLSIFRTLLACGLSFIGTVGLMIDLFNSDINRQIGINQSIQKSAFQKQAMVNHQYERSIIDSTENKYQRQFDRFAELAAKEPGGTKTTKAGPGPIARYYIKQRDVIATTYLKPIQAKRDSLNRAIDGEVDADAKFRAANIGLWTRIKALFSFAFEEPGSIIAFLTLFSVLCFLELMVLAIKIGAPETPFDIHEQDAYLLHHSRRRNNSNTTYQYTFSK